MKEINIYCSFVDSIDKCDYTVFIYDMDKNLIYKDRTNKNIKINLPYNLYKVVVKVHNSKKCNIITKNLLIYPICCDTLSFQFQKNMIRKPYINIFLTDKNYNGLKIEKGEITLWPKIT